MAIIVPVQSYPIDGNHNFLMVSWIDMANGDEGEPFILSQYADRSVQAVGTFSGADITIQGSNDTITYATLSDPIGDPLLMSLAQIKQVLEVSATIKPVVANGDGSTSVSIHMLVKS